MITKNSNELFVFHNGSTQSFPNKTNDNTAIVVLKGEHVADVVDTSGQDGYEWAKAELESSDVEIKYHERNSKRAKLALDDWYKYQEDLRDYATCDDDGNYSILTDKPVRPV